MILRETLLGISVNLSTQLKSMDRFRAIRVRLLQRFQIIIIDKLVSHLDLIKINKIFVASAADFTI